MKYVFLAVAIIGEVFGTSMLKASHGFSRAVPGVLSVAAYAVTFYFLSLALKSIPTGVAYAIWSGVGIVLISTIGWIFFKQRLDAAALIGMGLICAGVIVINVFSNSIGD